MKYLDVVKAGNKASIANIRKTFTLVQESGIPHEFRTTICPGIHTSHDFGEMAGYLRDGERYFIQNINFQKTLDPSLPREIGFTVSSLVEGLRETYPHLYIEER